ncbi:hypothetical protein BDP27DRAFT_1425602 [Rhodocollybia butyracea]|uniref:Uncharacterized protein n=1 Tax=Rhodocollybia butyracea TaxID=206335 RepID=A0A9P5PIV7_9AGAR|nr:hypothetical protein BDP27DRAFT_1425602 [Rhodocollybia butyracea]
MLDLTCQFPGNTLTLALPSSLSALSLFSLLSFLISCGQTWPFYVLLHILVSGLVVAHIPQSFPFTCRSHLWPPAMLMSPSIYLTFLIYSYLHASTMHA